MLIGFKVHFGIFFRVLVVQLEYISAIVWKKKILWKSVATVNCLVNNILCSTVLISLTDNFHHSFHQWRFFSQMKMKLKHTEWQKLNWKLKDENLFTFSSTNKNETKTLGRGAILFPGRCNMAAHCSGCVFT